MERKDKISKMSLIIGGVVIISLFHYLTRQDEKYFHLFYRELYFFPLILAGVWFGLRGAVYTVLSITLLFLPIVLNDWQGFSVNDFDQILEITIFIVVAIVLGYFSNREKALIKNLQESESLSTLGRAVSGIVHDMKTPLMAIGGYARSIKRRINGNDPNHEKLDIIVKETKKLEELTKDVLDYARPITLNQTTQNLNHLVQECCPIAVDLAEQHQVKIETQLSSALPMVKLDSAAMERVLLNLITNAVQASPEGGVVIIRTVLEWREAAISISDQGPGIPSELREKIFFPFFTTKKEGTGLGLPISLKIVKAHGGSITINDHDGKGTIVRVILPHLGR